MLTTEEPDNRDDYLDRCIKLPHVADQYFTGWHRGCAEATFAADLDDVIDLYLRYLDQKRLRDTFFT